MKKIKHNNTLLIIHFFYYCFYEIRGIQTFNHYIL